MKKVGDIMNEMGFRKDAPESVKEAFLKHLIKNTTGIELETPSEKIEKKNQTTKGQPAVSATAKAQPPKQLSFLFSQDQGPGKKVS